jgi:hypothetical protein
MRIRNPGSKTLNFFIFIILLYAKPWFYYRRKKVSSRTVLGPEPGESSKKRTQRLSESKPEIKDKTMFKECSIPIFHLIGILFVLGKFLS